MGWCHYCPCEPMSPAGGVGWVVGKQEETIWKKILERDNKEVKAKENKFVFNFWISNFSKVYSNFNKVYDI